MKTELILIVVIVAITGFGVLSWDRIESNPRIAPDYAVCVNECRVKTARIQLPLKFETTKIGPFSDMRARELVEYQGCLIVCGNEIKRSPLK